MQKSVLSGRKSSQIHSENDFASQGDVSGFTLFDIQPATGKCIQGLQEITHTMDILYKNEPLTILQYMHALSYIVSMGGADSFSATCHQGAIK